MKPTAESLYSDSPYCMRCGRSVRFNVPRLGPDGGFVHEDGSPCCNEDDLKSLSRALKHIPSQPVRLPDNLALMAGIAGGIPCKTEMKDGKFLLSLTQPVEAWLDGGVIKLFARPEQKEPHA